MWVRTMKHIRHSISFIILISITVLSSMIVFADDANISLDKSTLNVSLGETFSISVNGNSSVIRQINVVAQFDPDAISFVDSENGSATQNVVASKTLSTCDDTDNGKIYVSRSTVNKTTPLGKDSGELVKINFKVPANAKEGTYNIKFYGDKSTAPTVTYTSSASQTTYTGYTFYRTLGSTTMLSYPDNVVTVNITGSSSDKPVESSYEASVSTDKESYGVGDTVSVTAALTPAQSAALASGSLKFSYDADALTFDSAELSDALKGDSVNDARVTAENGIAAVSFNTKSDASGISVTKDSQLELATFKFTAKAAGAAEFKITEAIASEAADGTAKEVTVTKPEKAASITIERAKAVCEAYGSDYKLIKYVSDALPAEGKAFSIGGNVLSYVPAYAVGDNAGKYVFVGLVKEAPEDLSVSETEGSYATINATGDANADNVTNIIDSQVVIYMVGGRITSASEGSYDWLNSDVNGDGVLDTLDAQAIQYYVHYERFGKFS